MIEFARLPAMTGAEALALDIVADGHLIVCPTCGVMKRGLLRTVGGTLACIRCALAHIGARR